MTESTMIEVTEYRLRLGRKIKRSEAPQLRGFFGRTFSEALLLHQHRDDGTLVYDYPRVQFKVLDDTACLIGLVQGSDLLSRLWMEVDQTKLGNETLPVLEARISKRWDRIGDVPEPEVYRFVTPWLALNQRNERRFTEAPDEDQRLEILQRTLVGNCISLAKSFGHEVTRRLTADCSRLRQVRTSLKGVPMRGFVGPFRVNFLLPSHIGIGKSVSRGFGTVDRIEGGHRQGGVGT